MHFIKGLRNICLGDFLLEKITNYWFCSLHLWSCRFILWYLPYYAGRYFGHGWWPIRSLIVNIYHMKNLIYLKNFWTPSISCVFYFPLLIFSRRCLKSVNLTFSTGLSCRKPNPHRLYLHNIKHVKLNLLVFPNNFTLFDVLF